MCVLFHPKNPSNAEYPAQNTVGVLLKRTWLANWATYLVRFKNKTNKKISPSSTPSAHCSCTYIPIPGAWGGCVCVCQWWEHLKSGPVVLGAAKFGKAERSGS